MFQSTADGIHIIDVLAVVNFVLSIALAIVFGMLTAIRRGRQRATFLFGCILNIYISGTYSHLFVAGYLLPTEYLRIAFTLTLSLLLSAAINELSRNPNPHR
jgi:hypothetical protein